MHQMRGVRQVWHTCRGGGHAITMNQAQIHEQLKAHLQTVLMADNFARDVLIYSEKSYLPKTKPSKIKALDSCLRRNGDFFSVSPGALAFPWHDVDANAISQIEHHIVSVPIVQ